MKLKTPPVQIITWQPKLLASASSGARILSDGRLHCWIEHETVRGVSPPMLVWWFKNMEGYMEYQGQLVPRYIVWHPKDHIRIRYARRLRDGSIGVGAVFHITEMLGGQPQYLVNTLTDVVRLDEGGFAHRPRLHGVHVASMDYTFESHENGTTYRNSLTIGFNGLIGKLLNPLLRHFFFDEARGRAWIKHNIEEVGQFEAFLPVLYQDSHALESMKYKINAIK
jgi:hypothetical protein